MTPAHEGPRRSIRAVVAALAITLALPLSTMGGVGGYNTSSPAFLQFTAEVTDPDAEIIALVNSGEDPFGSGTYWQGIPDGIGVVPGDGWVDLFVTHEQSHVPFGGFADLEDSSVSRVRVDVAGQSVTDLENQFLPATAGFIRFCSAFMAGPSHGFDAYTFFVNEESNEEILSVPAGAVYGSDPSLAPNRQAGYSVWLDTETGEYDVISRAGRHNHENTVVVPGGWKDIAILSGDDTFTAPSSQLYLYTAKDDDAVQADKGQLFAFQVTATDAGPLADPYDPQNNANDFLEIEPGDAWSGRFIHVPTDIARGLTNEPPQTALENWSNANNVFQFVRVEDIATDPDNPRVVYFADTGTTRLKEDLGSGRLFRAGSTGWPFFDSDGRIFRMVLNARDPRIVDSFEIVDQGKFQRVDEVLPQTNPRTGVATVIDAGVGFVNPDNLDISHNSLMVQEDSASANDVWQYTLDAAEPTWMKVATVTGTGSSAESSGIVRLEGTGFPAGWWALDVQGHQNLPAFTVPGFTWVGPPSTATGPYSKRLEEGQLLLMYIPGS